MTVLLLPLLGLALLDSINPSALAVTIYLLLTGRPFTVKVLTYVAGVFSSYLVLGVVIMVGLGSVRGYLDSPVAYAAQGVIGATLSPTLYLPRANLAAKCGPNGNLVR